MKYGLFFYFSKVLSFDLSFFFFCVFHVLRGERAKIAKQKVAKKESTLLCLSFSFSFLESFELV